MPSDRRLEHGVAVHDRLSNTSDVAHLAIMDCASASRRSVSCVPSVDGRSGLARSMMASFFPQADLC